jgi:hypothetical protein
MTDYIAAVTYALWHIEHCNQYMPRGRKVKSHTQTPKTAAKVRNTNTARVHLLSYYSSYAATANYIANKKL